MLSLPLGHSQKAQIDDREVIDLSVLACQALCRGIKLAVLCGLWPLKDVKQCNNNNNNNDQGPDIKFIVENRQRTSIHNFSRSKLGGKGFTPLPTIYSIHLRWLKENKKGVYEKSYFSCNRDGQSLFWSAPGRNTLCSHPFF